MSEQTTASAAGAGQSAGNSVGNSAEASALAPASPPIQADPSAASALPTTHRLSLQFTGSGSEYFRIWIVNLLLTLVTVGLYFPWAKVRRLRYFYGNTLIDGEPLDFHGDAFKMFKGFLIVLVFMAGYTVAGKVSPMAGLVAFLIIAALWPALLKTSMQFRMANTSWRGLRFGFSGTLRDAYVACLPLFIPSILILGLFAVAPELQGHDPAVKPSSMWVTVFLLVMLFATIITPWLMWNLKKYQHNHYRFSSEASQFQVTPGRYYVLSLKLLGIVIVMYIAMAIVAVVGIFGAQAVAAGYGGLPKGPMAMVLQVLAGMVIGFMAFSVIKPYAVARFQNLVWNGTRTAQVQFYSNLRVRSLFALTVKNWLLMVVTLGLYWPFAAVSMARMRLQAVHLESSISPADLMAAPVGIDGQAIGEASGDFLGIDIGL